MKHPYTGPLMPHAEMLQALEDLIGATMASEERSATFESLLYSLQAFISDPQRIEGPELFKALRGALNLLNAFKAKPMMQGGFVPQELELIAKWEIVLAKARGEQPHGE
jgi:hypothetical protein